MLDVKKRRPVLGLRDHPHAVAADSQDPTKLKVRQSFVAWLVTMVSVELIADAEHRQRSSRGLDVVRGDAAELLGYDVVARVDQELLQANLK